jgi:hypothetical protein
MDKMRKYISYCGLYCKDCIPGNNDLFETIEKLENICDESGLEEYTGFKSKRNPSFKDYSVFRSYLKELKKLKCSGSCVEGPQSKLGCTMNCEIRKCVLGKNYKGCWDCGFFEKCELIIKQSSFHPGLIYNLKTIKDEGIDIWLKKRGKHYAW